MEPLRTPDVYIKEEATLPPSVAEISTAVPVFIGHTQQAVRGDDSLHNIPIRINSLPEYRLYFGGPDLRKYVVTVEDNTPPYAISIKEDVIENAQKHQLYYALDHFFKNGGSDCYIISIGTYQQPKTKANFSKALEIAAKEDEPTLIVLSEACTLAEQEYYDLCSEALRKCGELMDRFCLIDVIKIDNDAEAFKKGIGMNYLKYGAAYFPSLKTSIGIQYQDTDVSLAYSSKAFGLRATTTGAAGKTEVPFIVKIASASPLTTTTSATVATATPAVPTIDIKEDTLTLTVGSGTRLTTIKEQWAKEEDKGNFSLDFEGDEPLTQEYSSPIKKGKSVQAGGIKVTNTGLTEAKLVVKITTPAAEPVAAVSTTAPTFNLAATPMTISVVSGTSAARIMEQWATVSEKKGIQLELVADDALRQEYNKALSVASNQLDAIKSTQTALYNAIKQRLNQETVTLPPSPAVAGVYATVDRERGVWKAPANVSLSAVVGPAEKIDAKQQERLNIDANSGKSINAIRSFTGRGTLIWGARTLAGNDNEWRYISVRRLFNMVEESAKKATFFAVFEPNDASTWLKVRGMIESYLYTLWQQGALAGPSPKAAYYVRVGLGTTMTTDDVNNGKMIIEIGMAAVRPAEFIVLTFSHKLQEA